MSYKVLNHPDEYGEGIRIIYTSARAKDGHQTPKREVDVRISYCLEEYNDIKQSLIYNLLPNERIYSSVCPRDEHGAMKEFTLRKTISDFSKHPSDFYRNANNQWRRCLGSSMDRSKQKFLFDLDNEDEIERAWQVKHKMPFKPYIYRTKNGMHIVTPAFNYTVLPEWLREKMMKDAMLLIAYWK